MAIEVKEAGSKKCGRCKRSYSSNTKTEYAYPEWTTIIGVAYIDDAGYRRSATNLCDDCIGDFRRFLRGEEVSLRRLDKKRR